MSLIVPMPNYTTDSGPKHTLTLFLLSSDKNKPIFEAETEPPAHSCPSPISAAPDSQIKDSRNQKAAPFFLGKPNDVQLETLSDHQFTTCYASHY